MSSFTVDRHGHATDQIGYMGHAFTVTTPAPPPMPRAVPPASGKAKAKRSYKYPEWRRKRGN